MNLLRLQDIRSIHKVNWILVYQQQTIGKWNQGDDTIYNNIKKPEILRDIFNKRSQDLYTKYYKIFLKEIKDNLSK